MLSIRPILTLFSIDRTHPELSVAQVGALARQVPLLHAILCLDAVAVAYTHYGIAPDWLTLGPLALLLTVCAHRLLRWSRPLGLRVEADEAVGRLRETNRLAAILGSGFSGWAVLLTRYGDVGTNMHVLFFLTITMIACIFCLMHLRSAALIIGLIAVPLAVYFMMHDQTVIRATAVNYAGVVAVMIFMQSVCYRDFCRLVRVVDENRALAHTDTLTGLPNRRSFFARLADTIEAAAPHGRPFSIAMIDLDGFKPVNDTFGHHAGDAVLCEVGQRLEGLMSGRGWAARLGGDEFGLILDGDHDLDAIGKAICLRLHEAYTLRDATARIGASIGFARFPEVADTAELLVERADCALYFAKAHHRGTAICFSWEHEARMRSQAAIEQALRSADLEVEFTLVYQPIVDVVAARITAYEALARWTSPRLGVVSPADFIVAAERIGLIQALTRTLFGKALDAMRDWPEEIRLSFNLSAHDIVAPENVARLADCLIASGIAPQRVTFELTETGLMRDLVDARRSLRELEALGVSIALDDFGTGYSSLSYLHELPISRLKIDRSFVTGICENAASLKLIRSILQLSRNLDLSCVIEGVETVEQLRLLRSAGCRTMQGYLFSKPMPAETLAALRDVPFDVLVQTAPVPLDAAA